MLRLKEKIELNINIEKKQTTNTRLPIVLIYDEFLYKFKDNF